MRRQQRERKREIVSERVRVSESVCFCVIGSERHALNHTQDHEERNLEVKTKVKKEDSGTHLMPHRKHL